MRSVRTRPAEADPIAQLMAGLEAEGRPPFEWAVRWASTPDQLAAAWTLAVRWEPMAALLQRAGRLRPEVLAHALAHLALDARAITPSVPFALGEVVTSIETIEERLARAVEDARAGRVSLALERLKRACVHAAPVLGDALDRALASALRRAVPAPPSLADILRGEGEERAVGEGGATPAPAAWRASPR